MYSIAIDIGSTFIKSALLDSTEKVILSTQKISSGTRLKNSDDLIHEIQMSEIMDTVYFIVDDYISKYEIDRIFLSTQMHGFILSGCSHNDELYVSWQDARCLNHMPNTSQSYLDFLKNIISIEEMQSTGVYLKPALGLCNLYVVMSERNFVIGNDTRLFTLGSYIIYRLTGNNICHITNAAPLGLLDIISNTWRADLIEKLGLSMLQFPQITTTLDTCGTYRINGKDISVHPDIGDVQASVLGGGANLNDLVINMATSGQIIILSKNPDFTAKKPDYYEIRPYFNDLYCYVISRMPGGRNLDVLVDFIIEIGNKIFGFTALREQIWNLLFDQMVICDPGGLNINTGFYELPESLGEGHIKNIDRSNLTIQNVFMAAFSDVCGVYSHYMNELLEYTNLKANRIVAIGSAIRKNLLLQKLLSEATGMDIVSNGSEQEVYEGLLKIAIQYDNPIKRERE